MGVTHKGPKKTGSDIHHPHSKSGATVIGRAINLKKGHKHHPDLLIGATVMGMKMTDGKKHIPGSNGAPDINLSIIIVISLRITKNPSVNVPSLAGKISHARGGGYNRLDVIRKGTSLKRK